ncbi:uncharacterized protein LOC144350257 [Saccoglossus kowalevskii]
MMMTSRLPRRSETGLENKHAISAPREPNRKLTSHQPENNKRVSLGKAVTFTLPEGTIARPAKERPHSVGTIKINSEGLPVLVDSPRMRARLLRTACVRSPIVPQSSRYTAIGSTQHGSGKEAGPNRPQTSDGAEYLKRRARRECETARAKASDFWKRAHEEEFFYRTAGVPEDVEFITSRIASSSVVTNRMYRKLNNTTLDLPETTTVNSSDDDDNDTIHVPRPPSENEVQKNVYTSKRKHVLTIRSSDSSNASQTADGYVGVMATPADSIRTNDTHIDDKKMRALKCRVNQWLEGVETINELVDEPDDNKSLFVKTSEI